MSIFVKHYLDIFAKKETKRAVDNTIACRFTGIIFLPVYTERNIFAGEKHV